MIKDTFTVKKRVELVDACKNALTELKKVINQEIDLDTLDPEKAKAAVQGKIEAATGYDKILSMITLQLIAIENERSAISGETKKKSFSGIEDKIG